MKFFPLLCCLWVAFGARAQEFTKCGTALMFEARHAGVAHPKLGRMPLFTPPRTSDSLISPNGWFRIHFSTAGDSGATLDYVHYVAAEAEAAYRFQCDTLKFPKPAFSFADSMWHIYIVDLSDLTYGFTAYVDGGEIDQTPSGFMKLRSFIVLDNDYSATPTKGLDAARITIEHEFFHVIQFGSYGALEPISKGYAIRDLNFIEMSSVWMEMRSTPWVSDYLFFLDRYLANIEKSIMNVPNQGYSQGIWLKFLEQRFGDQAIRELWEDYGGTSGDPLKAFDHAIGLHSSTFCREYERFGTELLQTGRRYRQTTQLPDAAKYPVDKLRIIRLAPAETYNFNAGTATLPASLNIVAAGFGEDTAFVTLGRSTDFVTANASVTIDAKNSYTTNYFSSPELFCDTLTEYDALKTMAFPIPFVISQKGTSDLFRLKANSTGTKPVSPPRLTIYTVSMKLVRHTEVDAEPFGGSWYAVWDGTDDAGALVSSGMYIYTIEVDGKTTVGKFPVIVQ